jgi:hypothetical protein
LKQIDELERVERSTYRYWYTDGLAEIATGCVFALLGIFFLVQGLTQNRVVTALSALVFPVLLISAGILSRRIVTAAKGRVTYPRTGYVAYRKPKRSLGWRAAVAAVFMAVMFVIVARRIELALSWLLLVEGLAIGAGMAYPAHKYGLMRFYGLALLSVLAAAGAATTTPNADLGNAIYFIVVAVGSVISGGLTLLAYLRRTRSPEEDEDA